MFSTFPPMVRMASMTIAWSCVFSLRNFSRIVVMIPPTAVTNAAMTMLQSSISSPYASESNVPRLGTFAVSVTQNLMAETEPHFVGNQPLKDCAIGVLDVNSNAVEMA
jgi:hypothetical protein